jgi:hypothetical protein
MVTAADGALEFTFIFTDNNFRFYNSDASFRNHGDINYAIQIDKKL